MSLGKLDIRSSASRAHAKKLHRPSGESVAQGMKVEFLPQLSAECSKCARGCRTPVFSQKDEIGVKEMMCAGPEGTWDLEDAEVDNSLWVLLIPFIKDWGGGRPTGELSR